MRSRRATVIALLGAESTGKTTLAQSLVEALSAEGRRVAVVFEYLREFCELHRRTPHRHEQALIANEQTRRIQAASLDNDLVIADTTALMIAVYSDQVFGDTTLYENAQAAHARCDLTLLTALDLPWEADGLQRDGPQVRRPVDALIRAALQRGGTAYAVVSGQGPARTAAALASVRRSLVPRGDPEEADGSDTRRWAWHCERCGDAACERHARLPAI